MIKCMTYARKASRRMLGASLALCLLMIPMCAEGALHSFIKSSFTEEPNVLILLDTSGSMSFNMKDDTYTYGDGSRPAVVKNSIQARYFGKDVETSNNDMRNEYYYHPLLRYISTDDLTGISDSDRNTYFKQWDSRVELDDAAPKSGESKYKHPNDSRMYALKNVMYRLLRDEEIYKGLRIGLATYYQVGSSSLPKNAYTDSNFYRWQPYEGFFSSGERQKTYWNYSSSTTHRTGLMREPIKSTSAPGHLQNLRRWFDGDGTYYDIKAFGGTPLCYSIYQNKSGPSETDGSALQFFRAKDIITDPCQNNYLIALTDGADSYVTKNPEDYVDNLTKSPMYVYGTNTRARNIKTYMMGFTTNSSLVSILDKMAAKGGTGRTKAFIASDVKKLLDDFKEIFKEIQSASTGQAPLVSPPRDSEDEDGLYVVEYDPQQARQWKGIFKKLLGSEDADGKLSYSKVWEAGERLSYTRWDARKIYTSFAGLTGIGNNLFMINSSFAIGSNPLLDSAAILGIADRNDRVGFIRWLCGKDEYGEEGGAEIHKLWDICNSGLVKVGAPSAPVFDPQYAAFRDTYKNRNKLIYVQSNAGMLHAFDDKTGDEIFAFIPPNVLLNGRLSGLRRADGSNAYSRSAASYSRYLLDGPVTVEDVEIGGQYKTLLLGQLGLGGAGMYVLDITSNTPEGTRFKWAIENDVHQYNAVNRDVVLKAEADRKVLYWKGASNSTDAVVERAHKVPAGSKFDADYDYRRLRRTVGVPYIGRVFSGTSAAKASWRWLFIMTSGSTNGVYGDFDSPGAVYLGDLDDGHLIRKFDVDSPVTSSVIPLSAEQHYKEVRKFLVGDMSGRVHIGDLSGWKSGDWDMYSLLEFPAKNSGISRSLSTALLRKYETWVFAGTGDVTGHVASSTGDVNYFAAANVTDVQKGSPLKVKDDLLKLEPGNGEDKLDASLNPGKKGWYLELASRERMASPPVYYGGLVMFTTFIPDEDVCSDNGNTRFYILNSVTGKSAWNPTTETSKKYKQYDNKKIPGFGIHAASEPADGGRGKYAFTVMLPDGTLIPVEYSSLADDIPTDRTTGELLYWRSR